MSTSIYDDPVVEAKPTSNEIRIAELKAIVANESELLEKANLAKETAIEIETAIRSRRRELDIAASREIAPLDAKFRVAQSDSHSLAMRLYAVNAAKAELLELSPLTARLRALQEKLFRAQLDDNSIPIRPVLLEEIERFELGNIIHEPQPERASSKRRELKRHDETIADIQSEINDLKKQIGIAP